VIRLSSLFVGALALAIVGCAEKEAKDDAKPLPPGMVPIGGEGRPKTLEEATAGESEVALWQVSDEDTLVYLLGTVHLMNAGTDWQTAEIRAAFNQSDATYLEADVWSREAQRAMGVVVSQNAEAPAGQTISSYFDKKQLETITASLAKLDLDLPTIDSYRPWFATLQTSVLAIVDAGGDPTAGADVVISREMMLRDTPIRYLESAAQQILILASGDDAEDAQYFYETMKNAENTEAYFSDLIGAWYDGDVERLDFLVNESLRNHEGMRQRLLVDRNRDWAQQIDRLLTDETGTYVIAVGVGHLVGKESVQAQLAARGYESGRLN